MNIEETGKPPRIYSLKEIEDVYKKYAGDGSSDTSEQTEILFQAIRLIKHLQQKEFEDVAYISKFVSGIDFYVKELEKQIGEEMLDFWNERQKVLQILTSKMLDNINEPMIKEEEV